MMENGRKRSRGAMVPSLLLVLFSSQPTNIIKIVTIFRHRVPNLRQAEVSQILHAIFVSSVVIINGVIAMN